MKPIGDYLSNLTMENPKEVSYHCPVCKDVGYILEGDVSRRCSCQYGHDLKLRKKRMGITPHMMKMTFQNFDHSFYSAEKSTESGITYRDGAEKLVQDAKDFVKSVALKEDVSGLFLQGDVGCGKTFIAAAVANALVEKGIEAEFVVVPDFLDQLRYTYHPESDVSELELMERIKNVPVLILDDLGAHNYTDWSVNVLYTIVNYRVNYELPMVITSNLKINEIDKIIGSRFCSRLIEACRFYQLYVDVDIRKVLRMQKAK